MKSGSMSATVGYGLFGLMIGLLLFGLVYLLAVRGGTATPTTGMWLGLFLGLLLVPAALAAMVALTKSGPQNPY